MQKSARDYIQCKHGPNTEEVFGVGKHDKTPFPSVFLMSVSRRDTKNAFSIVIIVNSMSYVYTLAFWLLSNISRCHVKCALWLSQFIEEKKHCLFVCVMNCVSFWYVHHSRSEAIQQSKDKSYHFNKCLSVETSSGRMLYINVLATMCYCC